MQNKYLLCALLLFMPFFFVNAQFFPTAKFSTYTPRSVDYSVAEQGLKARAQRRQNAIEAITSLRETIANYMSILPNDNEITNWYSKITKYMMDDVENYYNEGDYTYAAEFATQYRGELATKTTEKIRVYNANKATQTSHPNLWTGTGFALKGGYILTNYHVVDEASIINIYGINGDFTNGVKATVFGSDKSNDLALLKISGNMPADFSTIPYGFKSKIADVGENVYVLGYPLTATMGDEVKLTNGIISARTGFEGDVSQYQISAPVQPGNSGGPLIDYDGNVIGVICAKHGEAENVSYAVKTSQVRNLIESVSDLSIMNTTNILQKKPLKDQVKSVKNYVYIIKCSNKH